ncbi:MAG TPA: GH92 family glycosyl hydrolase [Bacteroidales bacterium]|nr:GH92 family glycosyl hydrolase [Bacteroidales bacterium]
MRRTLLKIALIPLAGLLLLSCCRKSPVSYVDPFIGTGGHGHTYPGASMPFGMVQLSPDTRLEGWDGCSGYHASDTVIYGFSHTHLSGTGCSDYGDILFMPVTGKVGLDHYGYASSFDSASEKAEPGYYTVFLKKPGVEVELTATPRCGVQEYEFPESPDGGIVVDLRHRDKVLTSSIRIVSNTEIEGCRISENWAQKQMVYFVSRFSKPFSSWEILTGKGLLKDSLHAEDTLIIARFNYVTKKGEEILVKTGISAVSTDGARKNLDHEVPGWDFDSIQEISRKAWNNELGKIRVSGGSREQKTVFYTALYHAMLAPNLYMDIDSNYRGRDLNIHKADGFDYYTVFSLWDTYRAEHPLFTIIDRKRTTDFIRTFLRQYQEGGMLPVWELSANETGCMIGYHAVPVIADAYLKGVRGFDSTLALEAMRHSAEQDRLGLKYYKAKGYIPGDKEGESVSKTLEYAFDDWCIAQMAKQLGREDLYSIYIRRAQYYKNLFDRATGFMRAKMNETWFTPFDPSEVNFNYTEANAWQYSFYVPQDLSGLMELMGGREKFSGKLDGLFTVPSKTTGREQSDISGMIGQYAHGNEPSHHMAYLYDYAGEPWKTQEMAHRILTELYTTGRNGLCGNEDCGQMSAWYVLSAMGFYPVTPGSTVYAIGTPVFPEVQVRLENGNTFTIRARNAGMNHYYIQSATLNGKPYSKCYLEHSDIMNGGELVLDMGKDPNKDWGSWPGDYPVSSISDHLITPVPSVDHGPKNFTDSLRISLSDALPGTMIRYTIDGKEPDENSPVYARPFMIRLNTALTAVAVKKGAPESFLIRAEFTRIPKDRRITLNTHYAPQYSGGGDAALIDFNRGGENFRTGAWQGYEGTDLDAVIDLGSVQKVKSFSTGFLQDIGSWIFFPVEVDYYVSSDGKNFTPAGTVRNDVPETDPEVRIKDFTLRGVTRTARYVHVIAKNRGVCPPGHPGAGSKAWIFADEITIN